MIARGGKVDYDFERTADKDFYEKFLNKEKAPHDLGVIAVAGTEEISDPQWSLVQLNSLEGLTVWEGNDCGSTY